MATASENKGMFTYQDRVRSYRDVSREDGDLILSELAALFGRLERRLFAEQCAGRSLPMLKRPWTAEHRIPARLFNSLRVSVEGKVKAVRASMQRERERLERAIGRAERVIRKLESQNDSRFRVHQKRRRLFSLRSRLAALVSDSSAGRVRMTFGSRKLCRGQYDLPGNGYGSHADWLREWRERRSDEFFVMGSRDEASGCQLSVAGVAESGSLVLRLRLPDCMAAEHGKYLVIEDVRFNHGHRAVLSALESCRQYADYLSKDGEKAARASEYGQALSYRFRRDGKGWRVFVSVAVEAAPLVTDRRRGTIGVDVNADHLAVCETDPSGNPVLSWRVPLVTYGRSRRQTEALVGDAVAGVVVHARNVGRPVVIERLDFRRKKAELEDCSRRMSRMLSSLTYGLVRSYFHSRGAREGVEVVEVNPAFSSVIGRVKFMERYGLSVHQAAALVLARRLLGCSERIPRQRVAPVGNGVHVAFTVPARKRVKHMWTYWGAISGQLRPALAAHHRLGKRRRRPNPVQAVARGETRGVA